MNLRPPFQKLLLALGMLAVMAAQLFGIGHGFLCDCSGRPMLTASDHCHGPHGAHCHQNVEFTHSQESHPDSDDTHSHPRLAQDFQSTNTPAPELVLTAPLLHVVFVLADATWENAAPVRTLEYLADERGSPPPSVAVSRTVVLLI